MRKRVLIILAVLSALGSAARATAAPGMFVGVSDDAFEWNAGPMAATADDLGLRAVRVTLTWAAGERSLTPSDAAALGRVVSGAPNLRIVLAAFNQGDPPLDAGSRDAYCSYLADAVTRFPRINDLVIWNEPNLSGFWRPQFASGGMSAPEQYEALAADCYDMLHAMRSSIDVIGPVTSVWGNDNPNAFDNISHSPTTFIEDLGAAYRASGRTAPLFDTFGHHPYPTSSSERPWSVHGDPAIISLGDLGRLVSVLTTAFGGTAQKLPDQGVPIWYLETGYQTTIPSSKSSLYFGVETWPGALPDAVSPEPPRVHPPDSSQAPDQATQLEDELLLTYCQPYVAADFNFMLQDEASLGGWQSGLLWVDGTRKASYDPFKAAVAQVNAGTIDCSQVAGGPLVTAPAVAAASSGQPNGQAAAPKPPPKRSLTKVTYTGMRRAPFGFLRLSARLTRGLTSQGTPLGGRQLLFVVGKTAYVVKTNRAGLAVAVPDPPLPRGMHRVAVKFQGDDLDLASGLRVNTHIVNSRGRVRSHGAVRLSSGSRARFSASSDGKLATGTIALRLGGATGVRTVAVRELGVAADGSQAWLRGNDQRRRRYLVHLQRGRGVVRIEIVGGASIVATVPASRLSFART